MITDFEDFCTWMYRIIDDIYEQIDPLFKRPGYRQCRPQGSDQPRHYATSNPPVRLGGEAILSLAWI